MANRKRFKKPPLKPRQRARLAAVNLIALPKVPYATAVWWVSWGGVWRNDKFSAS